MLEFKMLTLAAKIGALEVRVHPAIVFNDRELVLCDAGYPRQAEQIESELNRFGFSVKDITKVVLTHHDHDHIGSLRELKKLNGRMEVIASGPEADCISGRRPPLRLLQAEAHNRTLSGADLDFGIMFYNYLKTIETCEVDTVLGADQTQVIAGLRVVPTPGHTPGHLSFLIEPDNVLISGDGLALENGRLVLPNPEFTLDTARAIESIRKIRAMRVARIACYHGGMIDAAVDENLDAIVAAR